MPWWAIVLLAIYAAGWLVCCRIVYQHDRERVGATDPLLILGGSLAWPLLVLALAITYTRRG